MGASKGSNGVTSRAMRLEPLLEAQDARLSKLQKEYATLGLLLKKWQKASASGELGALSKTGDEIVQAASRLSESVRTVREEWNVEGDYLGEGHWLDEIEEIARGADLRVLRDGETLVAPPSTLRIDKSVLKLNGDTKKGVRPSALVAEMKRIAEKQPTGGKDFLESLYGAWKVRRENSDSVLRLREAYETFSLAPGWKTENTRNNFAQRLYALHSSGVYTTRDGTPFNLQEPSGATKPDEVFRVRGRDGREIVYWGIGFNPEAKR